VGDGSYEVRWDVVGREEVEGACWEACGDRRDVRSWGPRVSVVFVSWLSSSLIWVF
jgi:hypothetical protein